MAYNLLVKYQTSDDWVTLDLYDDVAIKIVYNVKDIREPQSVKSNYTQTFTIPGSKTNRKFFETLDQSGFYPTLFSPNLKVSAQLLNEEDVLIEGFLQVSQVTRDDSRELQEYEIIVYGEISSLFSEISGLDFKSIDLSDYNHTLTAQNILDSWGNKIFKNGVKAVREMGEGYVYPMEYRGQQIKNGEEQWTEQDWKPSIYVKTLWDRIFNLAGKTYTSDFINTDRFKRLILPFSNENLYLTEEEIKKREFLVRRTSYQTTAGYTPQLNAGKAETSSYAYLNFDTEVNDPVDVFQAGTTFKPFNTFIGTLYCNLRIRAKYDATGVGSGGIWKVLNDKNNTGSFPIYVRIWDLTATPQKIIYSKTFQYKINLGNRLGSPSYDDDQEFFIECPYIFEKGHKYIIKYAAEMPTGNGTTKFVNAAGQYIGGTVTFQHSPWVNDSKPSDLYFVLNNNIVNTDDDVNLNTCLPDLSLEDFLTSINKMFNLYWQPNPDKLNDFIIEPKDELYNKPTNKILDWTYKADRDEDITIQPLEEINNNKYLFTYTEDKDKYNESYQIQYNEVFGQRVIEIVNEFKTETEEVELAFSPTPLIVYKDGKAIPSYVQEDTNNVLSSYEPNVRILYWGGLINKEKPNINTWYLMSKGTKFFQSSTIYPYAGHFDNPFNPSYDLNFGLCKEYYHNTPSLTSNNLFNLYWLNTINDLLSIDNHLLTMTAHLTPYDIYNFNIFDTIQMDEVFYRINKIEYDIITEIAKIELYKVTNVYNGSYKPGTIITPPSPIAAGGSTGGSGTGGKPWNGGWIDNWTWTKAWRTDSWSQKTTYNWNGVYDSEWNTFDTLDRNTRYGDRLGYAANASYKTFSAVNSYAKVDSRNNLFYTNRGAEVNGSNNTVRDAFNVSIIGNDNVVSDNSSNIKILGDRNFVSDNVKNVEVFGDNNFVTLSDATYRDGAVTRYGKTMRSGTIVRGGVNTVGDPFSLLPPVIRGGIDAVENFGGCKDVQVIRGGVNNTLFNDY